MGWCVQGSGRTLAALLALCGQVGQGLHIQNQCHFARTQNGGAANAAQVAKELAQGFDHGLELTQQLIDHDPRFVRPGCNDDDVFTHRWLALNLKEVAQTDEGQHLAAQVQHVPARVLRLQFQALHHGIERNHVRRWPHRSQETVDDGQGQWQPDGEARTLAWPRSQTAPSS